MSTVIVKQANKETKTLRTTKYHYYVESFMSKLRLENYTSMEKLEK